MTPFDPLLVIAGVLLLLGVLGSKASGRLGIPALLIFLVIASFILFAGGLDTRWSDIRPVLAHGVGLATVAVTLTAAVTGLFASWVLGLPWAAGLLLGAIVSSTNAAAVFSVLRSRGVRLRSRLRSLLELESGSNDPMAIFLTVALTALLADGALGPGEWRCCSPSRWRWARGWERCPPRRSCGSSTGSASTTAGCTPWSR